MPMSKLKVPALKVRSILESVIPTIQGKLETARVDELEKKVEKALHLPEKSLWCRLLFIRPFNRKERQVFFIMHDGKILIVRMVNVGGRWVRALPSTPWMKKTRPIAQSAP